MTILDPGARPGHDGRDAAQPSPRPNRLARLSLPGALTAARLKVGLTLNAAELNAVKVPDKPRITLRIRLLDRTLTAEIAAKSLCKTQTAIREAGTDNIALMLQGRLIAGDVIAEAGLSAQPKAAKPPQAHDAHINHG
jgi:hypothetical protein